MFPYASSLLITPPTCTRPRKWIIIVASQGSVQGPSVVYTINSTPSTEDEEEYDASLAEPRMRRRSRRKSSSFRQFRHQLKPLRGSILMQAITDNRYRSPLQCLLLRCNRWNFDSFLLTKLSYGHPVISLGLHLFQEHSFDTIFKLDPLCVLCFLQLIESAYAANKFHSATHAADVAQAMHCLLAEPKIKRHLSPLEKLACILSAFGHDVYHPGVNQKFLESSKHFLCPLYNNVSVLENFHWRCLVSILRESNLLKHLPTHMWKSLIDLCKVLILATDMQRQQEYLNQFQVFLSDSSKSLDDPAAKQRLMQADHPAHFSTTYPGKRNIFLMQILIKCADIGNPCRPWKISQEWSYRASTEFFQQGDQERRLQYPVTSFCDRYATSVPKIQSGFMQFVAEPLFSDWNKYMGTTLSKQLLDNLVSNCAHWTLLLKSEVDAGVVSCERDTMLTAKSSLEEAAEYELQPPTVLQRRRVSASLLLTTPYRRQSTYTPRISRRTSLPVPDASLTSWTIKSPANAGSTSSVFYTHLPHPSSLKTPSIRLQLPETLMHLVTPSMSTPPPSIIPSRGDAQSREPDRARAQYQSRRRHSEPLVTPPPSLFIYHNGSPRLSTRRANTTCLIESGRANFPRRGSMPLSLLQLETMQTIDSLHSCVGVS